MDKDSLQDLLMKVREGTIDVDEALLALKTLPYKNLGFARADSHRALRTGFPEVIFCQGKSIDQIKGIVTQLTSVHKTILASRASREVYEAIKSIRDNAQYNEEARMVIIGDFIKPPSSKKILLISAGTSDIPVAEEAAVTAEAMGNIVQRLYDVGVAGIHRLFDNVDILFDANVIIVVAGMDGALPSIIGGMVDKPVIAVPTSVGYGASFDGLSALLTMLNSCSTGVVVVNIDNGFGAGYFAGMINQGLDIK